MSVFLILFLDFVKRDDYLSTYFLNMILSMATCLNENNFCIILCGGMGNRLWPYSRARKPKQFLDLLNLGKSMLQITFDRYSQILPSNNIFIVTQKEFVGLVREQLPSISLRHIISEPVSLGTAPAVALASTFIYETNPHANIIVTPTDQLIFNEDDFRNQITSCLKFVENEERFVVVGVKPHHPETSYGYIQIGKDGIGDFVNVKSFTEKPSLDFARIFCESGEFFWSTGLFLFNIKTYINAYGSTHPNLKLLIERIDFGLSHEDIQKFIEEQYPRTLYQALDMLILEHCPNVYIKVGTFGWADLGNWDNLYDISQKDYNGNAILNSTAELYDSKNNIIRVPQDKVVFVKGLENYLITENGNVLMICPKEDSSLHRRMMTDAKMKYGDKMG